MSAFSSFGNYLFGVPQSSSAPYQQQADQLQQKANAYAGREQTDYNNETGLGDSLWRTANGTAPSAADMSLTQDFGQNLKNATAMGAGSTGMNAVLARYLATQAGGNTGAQLAQASGIQKAKEASDAQRALAGLYGNMDAASAGLYGTNLNTGLGYSQLKNNVDQANSGRAQQAEAAGLQALSGAGSMFFGKPPGGGGGGGGGGAGSGGGGDMSGLGSSDGATSNAAWDAFAA